MTGQGEIVLVRVVEITIPEEPTHLPAIKIRRDFMPGPDVWDLMMLQPCGTQFLKAGHGDAVGEWSYPGETFPPKVPPVGPIDGDTLDDAGAALVGMLLVLVLLLCAVACVATEPQEPKLTPPEPPAHLDPAFEPRSTEAEVDWALKMLPAEWGPGPRLAPGMQQGKPTWADK